MKETSPIVFDAIEQFDSDRIVLRVEDLNEEVILRISIDSDLLSELIDSGKVHIIDEYDISYDDDY